MAQFDSYLKRLVSENEFSYQEDLLDLYSSIPSEDLQTLFAVYHTQLNKWFTTLNGDLTIGHDEEGNLLYKGGYFHAQDSRNLLFIMDAIDQLRTKCRGTEYAFKVCDDYTDAIRRCRQCIVKSGGSILPEDFHTIEIIDLSPVFQLENGITIPQDRQAIYRSLKAIGEGSYAHVFSYTDPTYLFPVILKRARSNLNTKELERFKQEYEVLKSLHSPYIIEVYAYNDTAHEYTMEFMNETIYDFIKSRNANLSLNDRKKIIAQICKGFSYIHSKNLLHRDISLTNTFIKHYEDVYVAKIGDFGLVKVPDSGLTSLQSEMKGSLNDPDLINVGFSNYEIRHETFALTRLCYYILTGRTNIARQKAGAIKRFWDKGTSPNKANRFTTADEVLEAIKAITDENK